MIFNTLLILIVGIGEWPSFPCGRVAFGFLQLSGNCFSRLGEPPSPPSGVWARPKAEPWGTPRFLWTHTHTHSQQDIHTSPAHTQNCARGPAPAPTSSPKNYVHVQLFCIRELQTVLCWSRDFSEEVRGVNGSIGVVWLFLLLSKVHILSHTTGVIIMFPLTWPLGVGNLNFSVS